MCTTIVRMKKNKKTQTKLKTLNKNTIWSFFHQKSTLIILVICCFILLFSTTTYLVLENRKLNDIEFRRSIVQLISIAVDGVAKEAPTASFSNQQFIDSAKVKFTKTESIELLYRFYEDSYEYQGYQQSQPGYIVLSSKGIIHTSTGNLSVIDNNDELSDEISNIYDYVRIFAVTFQDKAPDEGYSQITNKALADGRTAYIWQLREVRHQESDNILEVIKTIESY